MILGYSELKNYESEIFKDIGNGWYIKIFKDGNGEYWIAKFQKGQSDIKCEHVKKVQTLGWRYELENGMVVG